MGNTLYVKTSTDSLGEGGEKLGGSLCVCAVINSTELSQIFLMDYIIYALILDMLPRLNANSPFKICM